MIYYFTPYAEGNLGEAYNHYCSLVTNENDWITFVDGDIMMLHLDWAKKWEKIIQENQDAGIVTCVTNRIASPRQKMGSMYKETNILEHKKFADNLYNQHNTKTTILKTKISGFFFSFKKSVYNKLGPFKDGILSVDYDFSQKILDSGMTIKLAIGFYVLHYYRFLENPDNGASYTKHLKS